MKKLLFLATLVALGAPAYAGIVVNKSGKVILGALDEGDVSSRTLTLHGPHLLPGDKPMLGDMVFKASDVRWFDRQADTLTDDYFDKFLNEPLQSEGPWLKLRQDYIDRHEGGPMPIPPVIPRSDLSQPIHKDGPGFRLSIRKPAFWSVADAGDILTIEPREKNARIHVFASEVTGERALSVTRAALVRIGARFDAESHAGNQVEWTTTIRVQGRTMKAVRKVLQMAQGTAFAIAYAEERDWPVLEKTLKTSLGTFEAN